MELFEQACQEIDEQKELIIDGMLRSIKEIQVKHTELKEAPHIATQFMQIIDSTSLKLSGTIQMNEQKLDEILKRTISKMETFMQKNGVWGAGQRKPIAAQKLGNIKFPSRIQNQALHLVSRMKEDMAVRIQRAVRVYLRRRKVLKFRAVARIARGYCVYRKRTGFRKSLNSYRTKIIKIQSLFRGFKARTLFRAKKIEAQRLYKFSGLLYRSILRNVIKRLNSERIKRERWEKRLFGMLNKCGTVQQAHLEIMRRKNFWLIFPEEGKFRMAVVYEQTRKRAKALVGWKLLFLENVQK